MSRHSYVVHLENFDGPLDLLLYLISKNEVNIYDIPIAHITAQYLQVLSNVQSVNLAEASDFYVFASTLLLIKSRILVPHEDDLHEVEDPRSELVQKLIEYQKMKKLSALLEAQKLNVQIERKQGSNFSFLEETAELQELNPQDLLSVYKKLISQFTPEKIFSIYENISIGEKITLIHEKLRSSEEVHFSELVLRNNSIIDIVCSFFAVLELVNGRVILVFQSAYNHDILIRKAIHESI